MTRRQSKVQHALFHSIDNVKPLFISLTYPRLYSKSPPEKTMTAIAISPPCVRVQWKFVFQKVPTMILTV
eukprot:scaffold30331_cov35-Attheya_sp.AAC.1